MNKIILLCIFSLIFNILAADSDQISPKHAKQKVVGIFTQPAAPIFHDQWQNPQAHYLFNTYSTYYAYQWGAQAIPVPYDASEDELRDIFSRINALVFTGGGLDLHIEVTLDASSKETAFFDLPVESIIPPKQEKAFIGNMDTKSELLTSENKKQLNIFTKNAKFMVDLAKEANDKGDIFPIIGMCQGFQLLNYIEADFNYDILQKVGNDLEQVRVGQFANQNMTDPLFGSISSETKKYVENNEVFWVNHGLAVFPEQFEKLKLSKTVDILQYACNGTCPEGNENPENVQKYVLATQVKNYPFFGLQYHPSYMQYESKRGCFKHLDKSQISIDFAREISRNFFKIVQQSKHEFRNDELLLKMDINHFSKYEIYSNYQAALILNRTQGEPYFYQNIEGRNTVVEVQVQNHFWTILLAVLLVFSIFVAVYSSIKYKKLLDMNTQTQLGYYKNFGSGSTMFESKDQTKLTIKSIPSQLNMCGESSKN